MKPLNNIADSLNPSAVNEVTHDIKSNHVDVQWTQPDSYPSTLCKTCSNSWPVLKISVLMPSIAQIHRQVLLNDAKFSKETKTTLNKLLQKYDTTRSKSDNDIGQTDLIKCT